MTGYRSPRSRWPPTPGSDCSTGPADPGATIDLTLTTSSPYLYDVVQVSPGRVPDRIVHRVTAANSMRITSSYADNGGFDWIRASSGTLRLVVPATHATGSPGRTRGSPHGAVLPRP